MNYLARLRDPALVTDEEVAKFKSEQARLAVRKRMGLRVSMRNWLSEKGFKGHDPRLGINSLSPEQRAKFEVLYRGYLDMARLQGKDISTAAKRRPYLCAALRWTKDPSPRGRRMAFLYRRRKQIKRYMMQAVAYRELKAKRGVSSPPLKPRKKSLLEGV